MKKCPLLWFILPFFVLSSCTQQTPIPTLADYRSNTPPGNIEILDILNYPFEDPTIFKSDLRPDISGLVEGLKTMDTYHLDVVLAEDLASLQGKMSVRYFNRLNEDLDEVVFRLLPNLWGDFVSVDRVTNAREAIDPIIENQGTVLRIPLDKSVPPGGWVDLELTFAVTIPQDDSGNYGTFGNQDGVIALAQFYPLIPLRDAQGWRTELYPPDGDVTVAEVANYLVRINAPESLVLGGSGVQIDHSTQAERQSVTFVAALAREFYLAGSFTYQPHSKVENGTTFTTFSQSDVTPTAKESLDILTHATAIFSQRFGEYPYRELDCVATPTSAGGVEYPGIMAINRLLFDPDAILGGMSSRDLLESVLVHEVAHEWFYNVVGNDQGREPWLDEAMAQYLTYQYYLDRYGEGAAEAFKQSWFTRWDRVNRELIPIGLPVEEYTSREYGAIVYGRGPLFLDALSGAMGPEVFDGFLKTYFETFSWKVATGEDFKALAESTCQCDLDPLFKEWVYMQ